MQGNTSVTDPSRAGLVAHERGEMTVGEESGLAAVRERRAEFNDKFRNSARGVFGVTGHEHGRACTYEDASRITVYR